MPDPGSDTDRRRRLPSVDRLLATEPLAAAGSQHGRSLAVEAARDALADARAQRRPGPAPAITAALAQEAVRRLEAAGAARSFRSSTPPA